jgi:peptidoglycan/xylan/chitin deacetylase (PgdA/CDA1 family)
MSLRNFIIDLSIRFIVRLAPDNFFTILNYHRFIKETDKRLQSLDPFIFKKQIQLLKRYFSIYSIDDAVELSNKQKLPRGSIVISIDDGYQDAYDSAFKILLEEEINAVFFISTSGLSDGYLWDHLLDSVYQNDSAINDLKKIFPDLKLEDNSSFSIDNFKNYIKYTNWRNRSNILSKIYTTIKLNYPENAFVTEGNIKEMSDCGMTIGAHTHNHPILSCEHDIDAYDDIKQSKDILERITGKQVLYFAYPNGKFEVDFNNKHIEMVRQIGFKGAVSTNWGTVNLENDSIWQMKRYTPWDSDPHLFCLRLAINMVVERFSCSWLMNRLRK